MIWLGDKPVRPNLVPLANKMKQWTRQMGDGIPVLTEESAKLVCQPNNPYAYSLGSIALALCTTINDAYDFAESSEAINPIDAEVARIRFESELIIFAARFCEAAIKQLLYCTSFPTKLYAKASMGQLLARDCEDCRKAGFARHDISLVGALAHRFFLCHLFENCAFDHLQLVARKRNLEAAHSESQSLNPRTAKETRDQLAKAINEIGYDLGHMADHIGAVEVKILAELDLIVRDFPERPDYGDLLSVPVRWVGQFYPEKMARPPAAQ